MKPNLVENQVNSERRTLCLRAHARRQDTSTRFNVCVCIYVWRAFLCIADG